MKRFKLIISILTIITFLLCGWPLFELISESGNLVSASLNFIYFLTLLTVFICLRISIGVQQKIELATTLVGVVVISLSTYTWLNSTELLILGKYTLGLLPILIGTTLMLVVKSSSKWSKFIQLGIGLISVSISVCVFTGASEASIYTILLLGMIIVSLSTLTLTLFKGK